MATGHWYTNGRYLMNPATTTLPDGQTPFIWNGSTTNYALYAALVSSDIYTPDPYVDQYLRTAIASGAEPSAATGYLREPVRLEGIDKAQKTDPTADYVICPVNASYPLSWTVNTNQTLTAGWIIFYWDLNIKNSKVSPLTAYDPATISNGYDSTSPLIAYAPFVWVDPVTNIEYNYWTTTTMQELLNYVYDTSFTGYSTILSTQVL